MTNTTFVLATQTCCNTNLCIKLRSRARRKEAPFASQRIDLALLAPDTDATMEGARRGIRTIFVDGGWREAAIYDRLALPAGATIDGPAILEQSDTTILIEPGLVGTVDHFGNVLIGEQEP